MSLFINSFNIKICKFLIKYYYITILLEFLLVDYLILSLILLSGGEAFS